MSAAGRLSAADHRDAAAGALQINAEAGNRRELKGGRPVVLRRNI